ncbi:type II restriction enzyme [Caldanaerovirga acetigignens]|uniref:Type-2 restriction enzyme n=1 Tax=Caldanaerovirga acetigignens TaxID=447595 RepID=A0A1M7I4I1_9FIRM|nr:type II restriction endonuclease [Caldanaerovirga acetigignens]SHM35590.1 type II restriction enzyme [Caldanaerovirga acetigignens]
MKELYLEFLDVENIESVIEKFHDTIIDTNRSYNFFVDWDKVRNNITKYKIEFHILNSLVGSKQFEDDLKEILQKYPQVLPAIPILLAIRELNLKVIKDFTEKVPKVVNYDFNIRNLTPEDIDNIIEFFDKTGLKNLLINMVTKNIYDYAIGVEVGLDSHARKNRSGDAMELLLKPIIEEIAKKKGIQTILFQKTFEYLETNYKIKVNSSIQNRKADFILIKNNKKVINIEVNFFSGTGSKPQEIVDSYIERQNELKNNGFEFIWITDGEGWKGQKNQIHKGFEKIDYLLNLYFVRIGLLEEILCRI